MFKMLAYSKNPKDNFEFCQSICVANGILAGIIALLIGYKTSPIWGVIALGTLLILNGFDYYCGYAMQGVKSDVLIHRAYKVGSIVQGIGMLVIGGICLLNNLVWLGILVLIAGLIEQIYRARIER